jgi:Tfp pilus assembly protein PilO
VTRRNTMILAVVAIAAVAGAYWFMLLAPKRELATSLSAQIALKETELQTAQADEAKNLRARASYRSNFATVARLGKAVPPDDDVRSLMVQIDGAAGSSHVDFRSITVGGGSTAPVAGTAPASTVVGPPGSSPVGTAGFATMPFSLGFKGSYFNLGSFFQRIDRFVTVRDRGLDVTGRLVVLDSIELTPDGAFPNIKAQISATTYLVPKTEGLLAGATPAAPGTATPPAGKPAPAAPTTTTATISGATR